MRTKKLLLPLSHTMAMYSNSIRFHILLVSIQDPKLIIFEIIISFPLNIKAEFVDSVAEIAALLILYSLFLHIVAETDVIVTPRHSCGICEIHSIY